MRTLVHSIVWCPEDQPIRLEGLRKHLWRLWKYTGVFDLYITTFELGPRVTELFDDFFSEPGDRPIIVEHFPRNLGWAWARNRAIVRTLREGYELLAMMDGDIWVEDLSWIETASAASQKLPVFMCRMLDPSHRAGGTMRFEGIELDLYPEWIGCINVARREVLETVGGYNLVDLPQEWGFHDCEWGRRLAKAGYFAPLFGAYPSLANLGVVEEQDQSYDEFLKPLKERCLKEYTQKFWEMHQEILVGSRPVWFNPETLQ